MQRGTRRPFQRRRLRYDAAFKLEADYCLEHAIPRSEWLERWSPEDRALVVAALLEKAQVCALCGTAPHEWEADPAAYAAIRHVCRGCAAKDTVRADGDTDREIPGSSIRLVPKETAQALMDPSKTNRRPMSARERSRQR